MENFIVSARKYRPKTFEEVVGQQHVTNTLKNAIKQNHLAQALLFTGPRGVGKTTCARILARMINTENGGDPDQDFSFNIFELDAASNNSVEDIRNLIDQVRFAPQTGNYKVYIIDEVHMLSQAAFNAFLKTLEEPPRHAIFILATTEKHKIIPTILSRCQIFDFKRITVEEIARHLRSVAQQENIAAEDEALHVIAQKADGALRDALSIFDRIVSFSGNNITYKDVTHNLRILDYDYYFKATELIITDNKPGLLSLFDEILDLGFDGHLFINGLAAHFRDLLVCKNEGTLKLLEVADSTKERYLQQSRMANPAFLLKALKVTSEADVRYKTSNNARLLAELCLLELAQIFAGADEKKKSGPDEDEPVTYGDAPVEVISIPRPTIPASVTPAKPEAPPEPEYNPEPAHPAKAGEIQQQPLAEPEETPESIPENENPETERAPVPQPGLKRLAKRRSNFSIAGTLNGREKDPAEGEQNSEDRTAIDDSLPKDDFTGNQLQNVWNEYIEMLRGLGKQKMYGTLNGKNLKLKENFTIELLLDNQIQASYFDDEKSEMLSFLRNKLNNFSLRFELKIAENATQLEPYSPQEKFDYMVKKNPHLLLLKQKLGLDVE